MNVKSENKFFIIILLAMIVALMMINFISVFNLKENHIQGISKDIETYLLLKAANVSAPLPKYLEMRDYFQSYKDYTLFSTHKPHYFYLKNSYLEGKLMAHVRLLLMWDCIIILVVLMLYYLTARRMLMRHESLEKAKEITLFTLNHKLKNYLAGQRINFEILKELEVKSADRLIASNEKMTKDLDRIFQFIQKYNEVPSKGNLQIQSLVKEILIDLSSAYPHKRHHVSGDDLVTSAFQSDLYFVLFLLLENAYKYSKSYINVKTIQTDRSGLVIIRNNINSHMESGLGVGLDIVDYLVKKNRFILSVKKAKIYTVRLYLK